MANQIFDNDETDPALAARPDARGCVAVSRADVRALWAVRVLDAWASYNSCDPFKTHPYQGGHEWHCVSAYECRRFKATSPGAARFAAAQAVYPTLSAAARAKLGECP
jgi:hypothetical protein